MSQHTKEKLGFNGFSGYYASISAGYGGFDWVDVDYMNAAYWQKVETNWCDTGYQNAIHGAGEAFTFGQGLNSPAYSTIVTSDLKETFSLTSMVAASAWETDQPFKFISYTYKNGQFITKASDTVYLSQTAQTINFAKMPGGKPTDFQNIAAVTIVSGSGKYGNTCTYGPYGYTTGQQMAFDNLKVRWNGKIPQGHQGNEVLKQLLPRAHHQAPHVAAHLVSEAHDAGAASGHVPAVHANGGEFHTEMLSLAGDGPGGGLTAQFALPQVEHFGS
jgi:hypothetical protein